jgi:DNA polymerase V
MNKKGRKLQSGLEIALNRKKFGKAVKEKREREGLSLRDLEGVVGVSPPTLSRIENGEISSPEIEHLLALCQWLRRPLESFFSGLLASLRVRIHYPTYVNAGLPAPAGDEFVYRDLCEDLMPDQDEYFTVNAKGDSMTGAQIYDGDLLIAKVSETANQGDIVIAAINGEYCVKRLEIKRDSVILRSANPDFPDIRVKRSDDFSIRGVVVHSIHRHQGTGPALRKSG